MTKQEMTKLVRSMGASENTVSAMENAYEMGVEFEREACAKVCESHEDTGGEWDIQQQCANAIRNRGEA